MRRFYIDQSQITDHFAILTGQDAKHLKDVLRLCVGEKVCVFDGTGIEYIAEITDIRPDEVHLILSEPHRAETEAPVHITLAQAFLKDKKMDTVLRQVIELGIVRWLPYYGTYSVPKSDKSRMKTRQERWEKIARESLKQCQRSVLPEICQAVSYQDALNTGAGCDLKIMFWEKSRDPLLLLKSHIEKPCRSICLFLGPEGGFSKEEVDDAVRNGFITRSLGPRILKAETASVALIQHLFGDMG
jgi:16S rRNA (uracil1498-N3)-methyltransferase